MGSLMNHRKRTIRILSSIQQVNMEVSLSRVTPKSSIYRWIFHEIHHPFGVTQIFINSWISMNMYFWLVISTILKHIDQWEGLSHILWKIKHVPNHQPVIVSNFPLLMKPSTKWPLVVFPLCPQNIMDISWIYHGYGTSIPTSFAFRGASRQGPRPCGPRRYPAGHWWWSSRQRPVKWWWFSNHANRTGYNISHGDIIIS